MDTKLPDWQTIERDYKPDGTEDDLMLEIKEALFKELTEVERKILLYYCEIGSYAGVARIWGSSPPTVKKRIIEIIDKLK